MGQQITSIIVSCAMSKDEQKAREALDDLRKRGFRPDVMTYTALISCLDGPAALTKAEIIFQEMRSEGIEPNTFAYNSVLQLALESSDRTRFPAILQEMDAKGIQRGRATAALEERYSALPDVSQSLPQGWQSTLDPTSGRYYYWKDLLLTAVVQLLLCL